MEFDLQKAIDETTIFLRKFAGVILLLMGVAGAGTRIIIDSKIAHTNGQKFVILFSGGVFSYLIGGVAKSANLSHEIISLIGFICGMFGYSIMKYVIDNEQAIFHNFSNFMARVCDVILDSIRDWFENWSIFKKQKENKNESDEKVV